MYIDSRIQFDNKSQSEAFISARIENNKNKI